MNGHDCTNDTRRNLSDCRVHTSVQALMVESVTERLKLVHNGHCPVAGNGRLIARYRSISDRSYWMVSLGYVSQDLAMSGLYWSTAFKFMVMFLQFAQRQKHCCHCRHQSMTSCRCGYGSRSQICCPLGPRGSNPLLLWHCECYRCDLICLIACDLLNALPFARFMVALWFFNAYVVMTWLSAWWKQITGLSQLISST